MPLAVGSEFSQFQEGGAGSVTDHHRRTARKRCGYSLKPPLPCFVFLCNAGPTDWPCGDVKAIFICWIDLTFC